MITINEAARVKDFVDINKEFEDWSNMFKGDYVQLGAKYHLA